ALGGSSNAAAPFAQLEQQWWWEGLLVVATFDEGRISHVKVHPLTLKLSDQPARRGLPQLAAGEVAETSLRQFSTVSRVLGTALPTPSSAVLDVPISENR